MVNGISGLGPVQPNRNYEDLISSIDSNRKFIDDIGKIFSSADSNDTKFEGLKNTIILSPAVNNNEDLNNGKGVIV